MTAQYLFSSAKRNAALAAIGGDAIGQIEVDLLKQVLVATVASGGGGGGGAAAWGSITGTLSAQTDLQTALDAKLNLTGGTMTGQLILQNASATGAVNVSPTWNNAGTNFAGIYSRVTNTASGANSRLMSLGTVAAGELCYFRKDGTLVVPSGSVSSPALSFVASGDTGWFGSTGFSMYYGGASLGVHFGIVPNGNIMLGYNGHIKFNPGAANIGGEDVGIVRTAAGTLKVSDAGTGHGTLDVLGLAVSGTPGVTYSGLITSITVINGVVTAVM